MSKEAIVFNIQKYSIHDGEGIRTCLFFKGCPLSCIWCHNPESQGYKPTILYNHEKCGMCQKCVGQCPQKGIKIEGDRLITTLEKCNCCGTCTEVCVNNAREIAGKPYTVELLMEEIEKDKMFYEESGGGVTLTGGEVMSQDAEFLVALLKKCHRMGYGVNIDTCGHVAYSQYEKVLPYVDTFLYDIKLMDSKKHKTYMGEGNELIFSNLQKLSDAGAKINIRLPLIEGINCDDENIDAMVIFLKNIKNIGINLLPYHNIGKSKYDRLQQTYSTVSMDVPSQERLEAIKAKFENHHFKVKIGG